VDRVDPDRIIAEKLASLEPLEWSGPYHCDVAGLTANAFAAILGPEERNPVPAPERWRGLS
jgi:hypothetical protein